MRKLELAERSLAIAYEALHAAGLGHLGNEAVHLRERVTAAQDALEREAAGTPPRKWSP